MEDQKAIIVDPAMQIMGGKNVKFKFNHFEGLRLRLTFGAKVKLALVSAH